MDRQGWARVTAAGRARRRTIGRCRRGDRVRAGKVEGRRAVAAAEQFFDDQMPVPAPAARTRHQHVGESVAAAFVTGDASLFPGRKLTG